MEESKCILFALLLFYLLTNSILHVNALQFVLSVSSAPMCSKYCGNKLPILKIETLEE